MSRSGKLVELNMKKQGYKLQILKLQEKLNDVELDIDKIVNDEV
ncbi:hypothetical protein [Rossellomorea marisflavi]|nr:hypothetical protein [Rossellomorea marisflavi]